MLRGEEGVGLGGAGLLPGLGGPWQGLSRVQPKKLLEGRAKTDRCCWHHKYRAESRAEASPPCFLPQSRWGLLLAASDRDQLARGLGSIGISTQSAEGDLVLVGNKDINDN